jgi:hypothetical protein
VAHVQQVEDAVGKDDTGVADPRAGELGFKRH